MSAAPPVRAWSHGGAGCLALVPAHALPHVGHRAVHRHQAVLPFWGPLEKMLLLQLLPLSYRMITTGMAVVLEESTIATPGAAFFVPEGWSNEVLLSSNQEYVQNISKYIPNLLEHMKYVKYIWNLERGGVDVDGESHNRPACLGVALSCQRLRNRSIRIY